MHKSVYKMHESVYMMHESVYLRKKKNEKKVIISDKPSEEHSSHDLRNVLSLFLSIFFFSLEVFCLKRNPYEFPN